MKKTLLTIAFVAALTWPSASSGYDPDKPPSSCAYCEEFTGDAETLTWRWANQGTSTITYEGDAAHLVTQKINSQVRYRYTTGADGSATDWVATMMANGSAGYDSTHSAAMVTLVSGTESSPTSLVSCALNFASQHSLRTRSLITGGAYIDSDLIETRKPGPIYVQTRYVSSTKDISCHFSTDGIVWTDTAGNHYTLGAHPTTSIGFYAIGSASVAGQIDVFWFRQRTDATGTSSPYPPGE